MGRRVGRGGGESARRGCRRPGARTNDVRLICLIPAGGPLGDRFGLFVSHAQVCIIRSRDVMWRIWHGAQVLIVTTSVPLAMILRVH